MWKISYGRNQMARSCGGPDFHRKQITKRFDSVGVSILPYTYVTMSNI